MDEGQRNRSKERLDGTTDLPIPNVLTPTIQEMNMNTMTTVSRNAILTWTMALTLLAWAAYGQVPASNDTSDAHDNTEWEPARSAGQTQSP